MSKHFTLEFPTAKLQTRMIPVVNGTVLMDDTHDKAVCGCGYPFVLFMYQTWDILIQDPRSQDPLIKIQESRLKNQDSKIKIRKSKSRNQDSEIKIQKSRSSFKSRVYFKLFLKIFSTQFFFGQPASKNLDRPYIIPANFLSARSDKA